MITFSKWKFKFNREMYTVNRSNFPACSLATGSIFLQFCVIIPYFQTRYFTFLRSFFLLQLVFPICISNHTGQNDLAPISLCWCLLVWLLISFRNDINTVSQKKLNYALPLKMCFPKKPWFNFILPFPYFWNMSLHK